MLSSEWSRIPAIVCINLKSRPDRKEQVQKVFEEHDIPVQYFQAERHPTSGVEGCFESHRQVIRDHLASRPERKYMLVFEDDLASGQIDAERLRGVLDFAESNSQWDLIFLGSRPEIFTYFVPPRLVPGFKDFYQAKPLCAHAYLISQRYARKVARMEYRKLPIDVEYLNNTNSFATWPSMFYQNNDKHSDIDPNFDFLTRSGLKVHSYKLIEWYGTNIPKKPMFFVIVFILLVLAAWLILRGHSHW